jgi:hypothetical protein
MKVFISHSPRGAALAQAVAVGLRREGLETWLPVDEVMPGDNWAERVSSALAECEAMVVLLTPDTATADNVQWEMSFALGNKAYRHRLLPVLVGNERDMPATALPWILERFRFLRLEEPERTDELVHAIVGSLLAAA